MPPDPGLRGHRLLPSLRFCVQIHWTSVFAVVPAAIAVVLALSHTVRVGCALSTTKFELVPTLAINNHSFSITAVFTLTL
jgi:hypothetical protein